MFQPRWENHHATFLRGKFPRFVSGTAVRKHEPLTVVEVNHARQYGPRVGVGNIESTSVSELICPSVPNSHIQMFYCRIAVRHNSRKIRENQKVELPSKFKQALRVE